MSRPRVVRGSQSLYPTVVMVDAAHHRALPDRLKTLRFAATESSDDPLTLAQPKRKPTVKPSVTLSVDCSPEFALPSRRAWTASSLRAGRPWLMRGLSTQASKAARCSTCTADHVANASSSSANSIAFRGAPPGGVARHQRVTARLRG